MEKNCNGLLPMNQGQLLVIMNPSDDPANTPSRLNTLLLIVLLIMTVFLVIGVSSQKNEIKALRENNGRLAVQLELQQKEVEALSLELTEAIEALQKSAGGSIPISNPKLDAVNLAQIENGLFTYEGNIQMTTISGNRQSKFEKSYKVNVIKTQLGAGSLKLDFVIGLATCTGLPQFFIDYDGDKLVDLDIMHELVDSMPFGGLLSKKMNSNNSQSLYDNFLLNHESADHLAASDIDDKGGALAKSLWKVITDQSEKITGWIQK